MQIDNEVLKILEDQNDCGSKADKNAPTALNEATESTIIPVPSSAVKALANLVQLYTHNRDEYSDDGLLMDNLDEQDDDYKAYIQKAVDAGILTIKENEVYVNNHIPVKLDFNKTSPNNNAIIYFLDPITKKSVFNDGVLVDPRDTRAYLFEIDTKDLPKDKIRELLASSKFEDFTLAGQKALLSKFNKDELIDILIREVN